MDQCALTSVAANYALVVLIEKLASNVSVVDARCVMSIVTVSVPKVNDFVNKRVGVYWAPVGTLCNFIFWSIEG